MIRGTFLCIAAAATLAAQINLTPKLQKGQKFAVELSTTRAAGGAQSAATAYIDLAVMEAGTAGSKLSWTVRETKMNDASQAANPIVKQLLDATRGFRVEFALHPKGHFDRVTNEAQVKEAIEKSIKLISTQIAQTIPDAAKRKDFQDMLAKTVRPEQLIESAAKDAMLVFGLAGSEVKEGKPVKMKVKSPHPLGAGTIDSDLTITIVKVDKQKGEFQVRTTEQYDPKSLTAATTAMLANLPEGKKAAVPQLEVKDTVDYTVDSASGLPKTISHKRVISAGGVVQRTDTKHLVLKKA